MLSVSSFNLLTLAFLLVSLYDVVTKVQQKNSLKNRALNRLEY